MLRLNMCGSDYLTDPNFLPPTLNFFSPNSDVGIEYQNNIRIKMTILNRYLNFYIHSVLSI